MKTKIFASIIALLLSVTGMTAAESATAILDRAASKLIGARTFSADFTIKSSQSAQNAKGQMFVADNKFAMLTDDLSVWFDGTTQWSADREQHEVNIYEPTVEEIAQINPLTIINNYKTNFKCSLLPKSKGEYTIELTPVDKNVPFNRIVMHISEDTGLPFLMNYTLRDGTTVALHITDIKTGVNIPPSQFVINKKQFPDYEFIDLR